MAEDDRQNTPEDDDATPQIGVPSHDPLPLPPEVHYTRPNSVSNNRSSTPRNEYGSMVKPTASSTSVAGGTVKYTAGLAGGVSLASTILGGYWVGSWIDTHWLHVGMPNHGNTPWATIVMVLVGTFGGFYNMFRILKRAERLDQDK
jgi:hypothetical protein